jgi:putative hydrolase of the HAD superfamily
VLWDIGGTLFDYAMSMERLLLRCLQQADIDIRAIDPKRVVQADEFSRQHMNLWRSAHEESTGYLHIATLLLQGTGVTADQVRQVAAGLSRYYDLYAPVPGVRNLLEELHNHGVIQGVVSDWPPSLPSFLRYHRFEQYFSAIVSSGKAGITKPAPAIFMQALNELGAAPSECVYVGDQPDKDINAAGELGLHTIHFNPRRNQVNADVYAATDLKDVLWSLLRICVDT